MEIPLSPGLFLHSQSDTRLTAVSELHSRRFQRTLYRCERGLDRLTLARFEVEDRARRHARRFREIGLGHFDQGAGGAALRGRKRHLDDFT